MNTKGVMNTLLAGTAAIVSIGTANAQAPGPAGTAAGLTISNTAQASYTVNGVQQTATSNAATFVVDRKVNLTVIANQPANTPVSVGESSVYTTFKVTNNTNGTQDFHLTQSQTPITGLFNGDNFDVTNIRIFVDANNNGVYNVGVDTATYINELQADQSAIVFIVADVPNDQAVSLAGITLIAQTAAGGDATLEGAILLPSLLANDDNAVDIVFADNDSDGAGLDIANNGQGRASIGYEVTTRNVQLTVTKSSLVITDPVTGAVLPKAIPGALVRYCLVVNNATALTPAANVTLTDVIPVNTTYDPRSISIGGLGVGTACVLDGFAANDDGSAIPLTNYVGSYTAGTRTVKATIPLLLGGTSAAVSFRVTIN